MPELRIEETSPTLKVTFEETEKPNKPGREVGWIGHPVTAGQKIDWENCHCEPLKGGGGIRVTLATQ